MKKNSFINLILICVLALFSNTGFSQINSDVAPMEKSAAKKGVYGGTYQLSNDNISVFYGSPDGIYAYEFDPNAKFIKELQGVDAVGSLTQVTDESIEQAVTDGYELAADKGLKVMFAGSSWGALKLQKGLLYLKSDKNFIYGFDYEKHSTEKLKVEDTWRTLPIGNRAIVPENLKTAVFKAKNGKSMSYTFSSLGMANFAPLSGYIQSAGIITEKVSIKNPPPYNSNRLVIFKVGGDPYEETSDIHIMPYAMQGVGTGVSAKGNFVVMTMPLNAPSTVKEQKALRAPDEARDNLYIYEIGADNKVISESSYKSALRTVNFHAVSTDEKTFIIGTGTEGKNWRMFYGGTTDMSGLTLAVLDKDGKISGSHTYLEKDFLAKFELAGQDKSKLQRFSGGPNFYRADKLDNGNTFIFGRSDAHHHGILVSSTNELIKYYVFPHLDLEKNAIYTEQLVVRGNKIYLVLSDQPFEYSNAIHTNVSSNSSYSTTTTSQIFEIFHLSQLFTIDGTTAKSTQLQLDEIQKDFYTLGTTPAFFGKNSIYFPGKIKALKGKELALISIPY
ncbi:MAG: hypothetical protein RBR87_12765 [Bacteroidales bacterium]|jgi:hypothetical protein|nr:hypothetical protein [Bacteroidales bacterium]